MFQNMNYKSTIRILYLSLVALVNVRSGEPDGPSKRMLKGQLAKIENFPYIVRITQYGNTVCVGSIITKQWVLTSADCIRQPLENMQVFVGHHAANQGKKYDIEKFFYYDTMKEPLTDMYAQLGLMKIKGTFQYGTTVSSISVNSAVKVQDSMYGDNCVTAGWGVSDDTGPQDQADPFLRSIRMKVIDSADCDAQWGYIFRSQICARGYVNGTGICDGDGGAPLVCNGTQIGILSFGAEKCGTDMVDVFTRVASYYDWIFDTVQGNKASSANRPGLIEKDTKKTDKMKTDKKKTDKKKTDKKKTDKMKTDKKKTDTKKTDKKKTDKKKTDTKKTDTKKTDTKKTDTKKTDTKKTDTTKTDTKKTDTKKTDTKKTDTKKTDAKKTDTKKTDTKKTDTKETDTKKTDTKKIDTKKTDAKKTDIKNRDNVRRKQNKNKI